MFSTKPLEHLGDDDHPLFMPFLCPPAPLTCSLPSSPMPVHLLPSSSAIPVFQNRHEEADDVERHVPQAATAHCLFCDVPFELDTIHAHVAKCSASRGLPRRLKQKNFSRATLLEDLAKVRASSALLDTKGINLAETLHHLANTVSMFRASFAPFTESEALVMRLLYGSKVSTNFSEHVPMGGMQVPSMFTVEVPLPDFKIKEEPMSAWAQSCHTPTTTMCPAMRPIKHDFTIGRSLEMTLAAHSDQRKRKMFSNTSLDDVTTSSGRRVRARAH